MKVLKLQIFHGNEMSEWKIFDDPEKVIKIGALRSSTICLEDVGRLQAVIEPNTQEWRLLDLGSPLPTYVNGERIRNAVLRNGDVVNFGRAGPWSMRVTIEKATQVDEERRVPRRDPGTVLHELKARLTTGKKPGSRDLSALKTRLTKRGSKTVLSELIEGAFREERETRTPYHHQATFEGLCKELSTLDDGDAMKRLLHQVSQNFDRYDNQGKADKLRALVQILREARKNNHRHHEPALLGALATWLHSLDSGTGTSVFDIPEEEVLANATALFLKVWQHRESMRLLRELRTRQLGERDTKEAIDRGLDIVETHLAKTTAETLVELSMILARLGGYPRESHEAKADELAKELAKELEKLTPEQWESIPDNIAISFREIQAKYSSLESR